MDNHITDEMNSKRPFEERVFVRFDALDISIRALDGRIERLESSVSEMDSRLEKVEARAYDTKPIWEQALKEIVETRRELVETRGELVENRRELVETRRELTKRLDRTESVVLKIRYDITDFEDRLEKLGSK